MTGGGDDRSAAAALWDAAADTFDDEADHGLRDPVVAAAWRSLLHSVLPSPPVSVADLGSGTGSLACLLAEDGYAVHGVDLSPRMVQAARAKVAARGVTATFEVGDAADPPLTASAYDVVLVRHVLWAMPDPDATVARWVSLLRPGGRLVLVEGFWHTGAGLTAARTEAIVAAYASAVVVRPLTDPALWGGPVTDERYLVVGRA